jgi:predicted transcriptional regulator
MIAKLKWALHAIAIIVLIIAPSQAGHAGIWLAVAGAAATVWLFGQGTGWFLQKLNQLSEAHRRPELSPADADNPFHSEIEEALGYFNDLQNKPGRKAEEERERLTALIATMREKGTSQMSEEEADIIAVSIAQERLRLEQSVEEKLKEMGKIREEVLEELESPKD